MSVVNQPGSAGPGTAHAPDHVGSGTGLVGLGERVTLAGGSLGVRAAAGRRLPAERDGALERGTA